jgi:hypothetical protein
MPNRDIIRNKEPQVKLIKKVKPTDSPQPQASGQQKGANPRPQPVQTGPSCPPIE